MTRISWATDLHLNFATERCWSEFADSVVAAKPNLLLIGGDISEAEDCLWHVERLSSRIQVPIYFVLGNHDFYYSGFAEVRKAASELSNHHPGITYLTGGTPVQLDHETWLIGDDAPADSVCGCPETSPVRLNDFRITAEYSGLMGPQLWETMRREGEKASGRVASQLRQLRTARRVITLTHAPVYREACWHEGQVSDDDWAPFFVCQTLGAEILSWCRANPQTQVCILSGHTHGEGRSRILPNLLTWTAAAEYASPRIAGTFTAEQLPSLINNQLNLDISQ